MRPSTTCSIRQYSQRYTRHVIRQNYKPCIHRIHFQRHAHFRPKTPFSSHLQTPLESSYSSYVLVLLFASGSAIAYSYYVQSPVTTSPEPAPPPTIEARPQIEDERTPDYANMPVPDGYIGNLTTQQDLKLRELWTLVLKTFGLENPDGPTTEQIHSSAASTHSNNLETPEKKKKKRSLFSRGKHDDDTPGSPSSTTTADEDDKYGQTAELQLILKTQSGESLRSTFWDMVKADHPDALLLRFLRARKWDVEKGLAMMISTMHWRSKEMHVDDDIMTQGEGGALADSKSTNASVKREGTDFLTQMRLGKSFLHGTDKDGRPITYVRARLHKSGEQTEKSMERYTVYVIETARLLLRSPVETACIVFDMTGFTLANMDYAPVKFMIKVFEANYPESLGAVIVHKAPWVFQGIYKIIKGWLDPVVAAKVHFTNSIEDMEAFMPKKHIIRELGGDDDWDYSYVECVEGENDAMKDTATRDSILSERKKDVVEYERLTFKWIAAGGGDEAVKAKAERDAIATRLKDNYWRLDLYVRARGLYDRVGMIEKGGKINFYPKHTLKVDNVNGQAPSTAPASAPSRADIDPDDDVD